MELHINYTHAHTTDLYFIFENVHTFATFHLGE